MSQLRENIGQYVSVSQAAQLLGVSHSTMDRLLRERKIRFIRPRSHRKVHLSSLLKFREGVSESDEPALPALAYDPLED